MRKNQLLIILSLLSLWTVAQSPAQRSERTTENYSSWVSPGKDHRLLYRTTAAGDRIMDFSWAGYGGGGVAIPDVPVRRTLYPSGGPDDTRMIQAAIDSLAALPLVNGFRGTLLLAPGKFTCSASLFLHTSGIVLRGSGSGPGGTTLFMTGGKHAAILIGRDLRQFRPGETEAISDRQEFEPTGTTVSDTYVAAGASSFQVADPAGLRAGDRIGIFKVVTPEWIHFMGMDNMVRNGKAQTWIKAGNKLVMLRRIRSVSGRRITIDVPMADSWDARYLANPGLLIRKVRSADRITQDGVENLHIQCPPLEINYGDAPYSAIRIAGDDCWARDIYCEETMNATTLNGDRITMQKVIVKHTFPNLGASKPSDFSIEGSQILLDRCASSGGNTYFVWTAGLRPGPNVLLNCTFRGHGSRIQPHQRWSTALLADNCSIPDGGLDFMNRGVAGSGHGWTMGWAVAWNCIAKTYVIQQPPGCANWAIGCRGTRQQTARLFDSIPVLEEGYFDSWNNPVTPQSLYLAQLQERLGPQALRNIGYTANDLSQFPNKNIPPLPPLLQQSDPELGPDLALHRPVNTSNIREGKRIYGGEKAIDGIDSTYWAADDQASEPFVEIDMENPVDINAVTLSEAPGLGQRVQAYRIDGQVSSDWKLLAQGTTIGTRKVERFPTVTAWKVRVTFLRSSAYPAISRIGIYHAGATAAQQPATVLSSAAQPSSSQPPVSQWVYTGPGGKLQYKKTSGGDRIMDFSYAGYKGGGVALPELPVRRTVQPSGGPDDTRLIQTAIDEVSALPLVNGFRGAVLLGKGVFPCSGTLSLAVGGVVLRGSGSGPDGTTIRMSGEKHVAIAVGNIQRGSGKDAAASFTTTITDRYVPSGALSFTVQDIRGFKPGDEIEIRKPVTEAWVHFMGMDTMTRNGKAQTWIRTGGFLLTRRIIAGISGNSISLDAPLTDDLDATYTGPSGTEVRKVKPWDLVAEAGVEHLHIQAPPMAVAFTEAPYSALHMQGQDCWARDLWIEETMNSVSLGGRRITLQQVNITRTVPNQGAAKPAEFAPNAGQVLLDRCSGTGDNIFHAGTGAGIAGPIVLLNCTFQGNGRIQGHQRWSTGMLLDNCRLPEGGIDLMNRGSMGSGHGWSIGWSVAWNCQAKSYIIQQPPGAFNWMIGCTGPNIPTPQPFNPGPVQPLGTEDSPGQAVAPQSLYLTQLAERLGPQALKNIGY